MKVSGFNEAVSAAVAIDPKRAVENINSIIAPKIVGIDAPFEAKNGK